MKFFDLTISFIVLLSLSPILLLITLSILISMGRPILFKQLRTGKNEIEFTFYKFRTMTTKDLDQEITDEDRITRIGNFLRQTSLDEIPSFFNVIKGEMGLVGPRPLLPEYLPLYSKKHRKRHLVKPGITGWAQINGRNTITWEEKFDLDIWYLENKTIFLDIKILFLTLYKVFKADGISPDGNKIMPKFKGKGKD